MEIPALIYFSSWSLITIASLGFGFISLHKENSHISPLTIFLLKRFLALSVCHSSTYALVHHRSRSHPTNTSSLANHLKLSVFGLPFLFYTYISSGTPIPLGFVLIYSFSVTTVFSLFTGTPHTGLSVDFFIRSITFSLQVQNDAFFPLFVLVAAFFTAGAAAIFDDGHGCDAADINRSSGESGMRRKMVEVSASVIASLAFHLVVRFESWWHVVAFLWFAVSWLGCIALTMAHSDLGVFHLLVCNLLVACVNRFGLSGPTLLANAIAVVLFILRDKVLTVRFVPDCDVILW